MQVVQLFERFRLELVLAEYTSNRMQSGSRYLGEIHILEIKQKIHSRERKSQELNFLFWINQSCLFDIADSRLFTFIFIMSFIPSNFPSNAKPIKEFHSYNKKYWSSKNKKSKFQLRIPFTDQTIQQNKHNCNKNLGSIFCMLWIKCISIICEWTYDCIHLKTHRRIFTIYFLRCIWNSLTFAKSWLTRRVFSSAITPQKTLTKSGVAAVFTSNT